MNSQPPIPFAPRGSTLELCIAETAAVYARAENDQRAFLAQAADGGSALLCPPGCGTCCERFTPDVLPVEAYYLAAWLLEREPSLAREAAGWDLSPNRRVPPCPFLRHGGAGAQCAVYAARPLVCRLFGSAGTRDKRGRASFRPCAFMPRAGGPDAWTQPPVMADYGSRLAAIRPGEGMDRTLLVEALPSALERVGLALSLAEHSDDRTYSKHDEHGAVAADENYFPS